MENEREGREIGVKEREKGEKEIEGMRKRWREGNRKRRRGG